MERTDISLDYGLAVIYGIGRYFVPVIAVGVVSVVLLFAGRPTLSGAKISDAQIAEIVAIMEALAANGQYSGTVLVSVGG